MLTLWTPIASCLYVVLSEIAGMTAPVSGLASEPTWIALVAKPLKRPCADEEAEGEERLSVEVLREVGLVEGVEGTVIGVLSPVERGEVSSAGVDDISFFFW